ncbi:hypothetical protein AB0G00_12750 [Nocardia salmonicida]|uniref:hypothetical protein n=1 Tax=Nocardia salmonicida TaxID=53431 RepID=UPI0033E992D7
MVALWLPNGQREGSEGRHAVIGGRHQGSPGTNRADAGRAARTQSAVQSGHCKGGSEPQSLMFDDFKLARLNEDHYLDLFECGEPSMDDWLVKHAFADQQAGISATHVWEQDGGMVFGYFTLVPTVVGETDGPFWKKLKPRSFPRQQAPGVLIGKIALDKQLRGCGKGEYLFAEAFVVAIDAMMLIGGVFLVIEPMPGRPKLRTMYEKFGFRTLDGTDRMYMEVEDFKNGVPLDNL